MTFVEELKQLSEKVELKHKLERQFMELKTKMKSAASNGYRCFKLEIFTLELDIDAVYLPENKAENYYCIYTVDGTFYTSELVSFLAKLGFDTAELTYVYSGSAGSYTSLSMTVEW